MGDDLPRRLGLAFSVKSFGTPERYLDIGTAPAVRGLALLLRLAIQDRGRPVEEGDHVEVTMRVISAQEEAERHGRRNFPTGDVILLDEGQTYTAPDTLQEGDWFVYRATGKKFRVTRENHGLPFPVHVSELNGLEGTFPKDVLTDRERYPRCPAPVQAKEKCHENLPADRG